MPRSLLATVVLAGRHPKGRCHRAWAVIARGRIPADACLARSARRRVERRRHAATGRKRSKAVRTKIIVNPMANKGACGKRWPHIRAELEKSIGRLSDEAIALTRARNHAAQLASQAVGAGCRRLVAVGATGPSARSSTA